MHQSGWDATWKSFCWRRGHPIAGAFVEKAFAEKGNKKLATYHLSPPASSAEHLHALAQPHFVGPIAACQLAHSRFASFFVKPPVAFARAPFFFFQALKPLVMQPLNPSKSLLRFVLQFCWPNHHMSLTPPRPLQLATFLQGWWRVGRHGWGALAASSHSINSRQSRSARIAGRVMHLFVLSLQQFGRKLPKYANGNSSFTHRRGSKDLVIGH